MKSIVAALTFLLASCSAAHPTETGGSLCKTPEQVAAEAEATLRDVQQRIASGDPPPLRPEDLGKSPAKLAEEAAIAGEPCPLTLPPPGAQELPQIN
jgi:hypothetical protein